MSYLLQTHGYIGFSDVFKNLTVLDQNLSESELDE